ncbi:alpha/beta fold hydrolase [Idiomarina sp. UBA4520]|jgi:pimeloyl-ACP methyl ester carboxylesterase|uniref:alpha/beta fold hydrolase n=1 Tax=Idiomarina sp. UBA4520 TaxID=1946647 RepID=UPI000A43E1F0|nr:MULTISPECIES: alpha/beta hydrolase [unclassified Idiomarina]MBF39227.1 alpha/beta hydrolase [Idiomarinaceae bacterium]|tara:strand:- start:5485 stop:6381 length:897 start_codon:yes stop_codon:yes gene_type:complete
MKIAFLISILVVLSTSPAIAGEKYLRDDGTEIRYYLDNAAADNLLVIFQGSDCNSVRHMTSVTTIWQTLAPNSALLTIEKYGIDDSLPYASGERDDCPTKYLQHDTMTQRINDGVQLIDAFKNSYDKVIVAGGSEGGSIALAVAKRVSGLHSVLALNSGSSSFQHDIEFSIKQTVPEDQRNEALNGFRQFVARIKQSQEPFPANVSGHGYAYWKDALERDLLKPLTSIDAPVVVIQSQEDKSVDPEQTRREINRIISDGAKHITLKMLPGLDHGFQDSNGQSQLKNVVEGVSNIINTK